METKECFGYQGEGVLSGDSPEKCIGCSYFDNCHKLSIAIALQTISCDLGLIVHNLIHEGKLKPHMVLDKEDECKDARN